MPWPRTCRFKLLCGATFRGFFLGAVLLGTILGATGRLGAVLASILLGAVLASARALGRAVAFGLTAAFALARALVFGRSRCRRLIACVRGRWNTHGQKASGGHRNQRALNAHR